MKKPQLPMPSREKWLSVAAEVAQRHDIHVGCLMGDDKRPRAVQARWEAWRALYGDGISYSISGIARRVGVDHSSIIHARNRAWNAWRPVNPDRISLRGKHPNSLAALAAQQQRVREAV